MATKSKWKRKLSDLRCRYGNEEAEYFRAHPACEKCDERRLAVLTVHHVNGRGDSTVKTLCFNCHMIVHAPHAGEWTYEDEVKFEEQKEINKLAAKIRNTYFLKWYKKLGSYRAVGRKLGITHTVIRFGILNLGDIDEKTR